MCVCERERERVCVREREREREKGEAHERWEGVGGRNGQSSSSMFCKFVSSSLVLLFVCLLQRGATVIWRGALLISNVGVT